MLVARRWDQPKAIHQLGAMFAILIVASSIVGLTSVPASAATCSGGATLTIDLVSGDSIALSLTGAADPLAIDVAPADPSCGGFDTSTVTTIQLNGTVGNESVTINQSGAAPFPHQNTATIALALGEGTDALVITGQTTADAIGLGATGISLDAGGTPDVTGVETVESVAVSAGGGDDVVSGKEGGGLGADSATALTIQGDEGNDSLTGGSASDVVDGGSGNDTLKGAGGADSLDGGDGDDLVTGGAANDVVIGGTGGDTLKGSDDEDTVDGGEGDDALTGGEGSDTVRGGDGNDLPKGGSGDDDVTGDRGKDQLSGGPGNDRCLGGPDPDSITGCEQGRP